MGESGKRRGGRGVAGVCVVLLVWLGLGVQGYAQQPADAPARAPAPQQLWVEGAGGQGIDPDAPMRFSSLSKLAEKLSPSVVNLLVTYESGSAGLGDWFGMGGARQGQGSGFIIHPDGYILTNYHVVDGASQLQVKLLDQSEYIGQVVGVDPQTDVALLKIEAGRPLAAIALGDSHDLKVGQHVLAIGNPLGLSHTVTTGIISALGRRDLGIEQDNYLDFIQTDASINPGNSGGPLIGLSGEVVGINTAINRHAQGIGFAIPIAAIKVILPQLAQRGYVVRSWLGIRVQALDARLAETFGLRAADGVVVTEVVADSPAQRGGIRAGDVILSFDGSPLKSGDSLRWLSSVAVAGQEVDVHILRGARRSTLNVRMEQLPNQKFPTIPQISPARKAAPGALPLLGVEVEVLSRAAANRLGAADQGGVLVTRVRDASSPDTAGLRKSDVILQVGEASVSDLGEFDRALAQIADGNYMRLKIVRQGRVVFVVVQK